MKTNFILIPCLLFCLFMVSCSESQSKTAQSEINPNQETKTAESSNSLLTGDNIKARFKVPNGYKRKEYVSLSFEDYLRHLPLKPDGTPVHFYFGDPKPNDNVYKAVIDLEIGDKNLHQCADAIIRLKAEYLWTQQRYDEIQFNFTNGMPVPYSKWMEGYRIKVNGNKTNWIKNKQASNTYETFWEYMETIFMYAGTLSLSKELASKNMKDIEIGDVFIKGGSPGHAVLVVDLAINKKTGKKIFMLAQSYMPAQETQILSNPSDKSISPWYSSDMEHVLVTPEWTFDLTELKTFKN